MRWYTMSWGRPSNSSGRVYLSRWSPEDVLLVDLDHGKLAAFGVHGVVLAGQLFLAGQQLPAPGQPVLARDDLGKIHR
jgi:hypothetical protein